MYAASVYACIMLWFSSIFCRTAYVGYSWKYNRLLRGMFVCIQHNGDTLTWILCSAELWRQNDAQKWKGHMAYHIAIAIWNTVCGIIACALNRMNIRRTKNVLHAFHIEHSTNSHFILLIFFFFECNKAHSEPESGIFCKLRAASLNIPFALFVEWLCRSIKPNTLQSWWDPTIMVAHCSVREYFVDRWKHSSGMLFCHWKCLA